MARILLNPWLEPGFRVPDPDPRPLALHEALPEYRPTPLRSLPAIADRLGLASVQLKDESHRLGLPAYKVLGAAWATHRLLCHRLGFAVESAASFGQWRSRLDRGPRLELVTATDGNHGRGVARVARWLGLPARVYLPRGSAPSRLAGIRSEGAEVVEVEGTYDDAVTQVAAQQGDGVLLVQDHGWPGYEEIPGWIADGYQTIFAEIERQQEPDGRGPDLVLVQIGVGTLASAVVRHYLRAGASRVPRLIGVEPTGAACALLSIEAGHPVMIEADGHSSIMAGLNCGTPSSAAWPLLRAGISAYVAVEDDQAREAMRLLAEQGIVAGESGAAGLAGLLELMGPDHAGPREVLNIGPSTRVLLLLTEGATDPDSWERITGRRLPPAAR